MRWLSAGAGAYHLRAEGAPCSAQPTLQISPRFAPFPAVVQLDTAVQVLAGERVDRLVVAAVAGCGLDVDYPQRNLALRRLIDQRGSVVSEYGPGTPPMAHHFPARNRIVAGPYTFIHYLAGTIVAAEPVLRSPLSPSAPPRWRSRRACRAGRCGPRACGWRTRRCAARWPSDRDSRAGGRAGSCGCPRSARLGRRGAIGNGFARRRTFRPCGCSKRSLP